MTSDVAAAQRFYSKLLGWKTMPFEHADPANPYTMWTVGGQPIGGVATLDAQQAKMGVPPHWITSVHVNNVDQTAHQAASSGGTIIAPPFDIPETGRYAILQDPTGAMLAIFSSHLFQEGFDGDGKMGHPSWHELMTTDYKRAFDFYSRLFGWEKVSEMDMGPNGMYFMFGSKGKPFGGMYNKPPEMAQVPSNWLPYVFVKDVTASAKAAEAAGGKVVQPPMDIPGGGSIAVITDPQGAHFAVHAAEGLKDGSAKPAKAKPAKKKAKAKTKPKAKSAKKATPKKKGASAKLTKKDKKKAKKAAKKAKKAKKAARKDKKKGKKKKK